MESIKICVEFFWSHVSIDLPLSDFRMTDTWVPTGPELLKEIIIKKQWTELRKFDNVLEHKTIVYLPIKKGFQNLTLGITCLY